MRQILEQILSGNYNKEPICVGCGEISDDCVCGERYETLEELEEQETEYLY